MTNDIYTTVCKCRFCAQNPVHSKKQRQLKLFFPVGPLEYVGVDALEPLRKTKEGNFHLRYDGQIQKGDKGHTDHGE